MDVLLDTAKKWLAEPWVLATAISLAAVLAAYIIEYIISRTLTVMARKTLTTLDDVVIQTLRRPIFLTVILVGLAWSSRILLEARALFVVYALLKTVAVFSWCSAGLKIGTAVLSSFSGRSGLLQPRTLPVFDMLIKIAVVGAAIYFMFLAWKIDVTAWLASAGIVGIAVGFAAKDTLANLFSGIFIVADAPYKVGDYIVLDGGLRGEVTRIGMRSTRILTRDDVEITIPNAVIGNSKIVNEAGGPHVRQRVGAQVSAAYGSDIDRVRNVLLTCPIDLDGVSPNPEPQVRFRAMGDSGLLFELLVWIDRPSERGAVLDRLNTRIYKAFYREGIEIPFPQQDVYIRQLPKDGGEPSVD